MKSAQSPHSDSQEPLLDKRFARDPSMVFRRIADECILVPIGSSADDVGSIYTLNPLGVEIWELIDGQRPVKEIRDYIVGQFEVSEKTAEEDLLILLQQLDEVGAIQEVVTDRP